VPVTARIDNTAPGAVPVVVEGGEGWRNRDEFNLAWQNQPEPDPNGRRTSAVAEALLWALALIAEQG
jgi:hypothetical protein